jgi:hypothetical protein
MDEQTTDQTINVDHLPSQVNKGGRPSKLDQLLKDQERYEQMLQYFRLGATMTAVCGVLGIAPTTFASWMSQGRDATKGKFREFYWDVVGAIGHASVMVEAQIRINNPMAWLKNGPRRLLGDEWRDDPDKLIHIEGDVQHDHVVYDGRAPATDEDLAAALTELKNAGLLTFNNNIIDGEIVGSKDKDSEDDKQQGDA